MKTRTVYEAKRRRAVLVASLGAVLLSAPIAAGAADQYAFDPAAFDIAAAPDGSILVTGNDTISAIRNGVIRQVAEVPVPVTDPPSTLNGLAAIGSGNYFATTGGGDLAQGAKLWRVSPGNARMVADIGGFETAHDPDAAGGLQWKDSRCEAVDPFSAGPQSNPYHLTAPSGGEALVADAAGNTLLSVRTNGKVDWVAVFTPPAADASGSTDPADWLVLFTLDDGTDCYVQPVPTSVAVGPDGAYYVGELTGVPAVPGWSRVWRIDPGARNVVCPSAACTVVVDGLTSVIDVDFGPDGQLYVAEYHADGWLAAFGPDPANGTVKRCDVATGQCTLVAEDLLLPSALTFDKWGALWLLENNIFAPTVRKLALP